MPTSVALAKLAPPRLARVAERPRLFRRLDEAVRGGVAWVGGPPGAGKTTLVASWLAKRRRPHLWFRLDEADGDVATFFHYFGLAARSLAPRRSELPRYRPDPAVDVAAFARHLARALYAKAPAGFTLVFDDFHAVQAHATLHEVFRALLSEIPPGSGTVVVSRAGPPASLARLSAAGSLCRIRPEELRLTRDEASALVRARAVRRPGDVSAIVARAGGWAAGAALLAAAGSRHDLAPLEGATAEVFEYFAGEVLERSDPTTRTVLLETALLPEVTATDAREVTGIARADRVLAELARLGYFTVRHPDAAVYTYHPLFREFLIERAVDTLPAGRVDAIRVEGARRIAARGAIMAAAQLLAETNAGGELARLVHAHAAALIDEGRGETVRQLIRAVSPERRDPDGWLQYWEGRSLLAVDLAGARAALERAYSLLTDSGDRRGAYLSCTAMLDSYAYEWTDFRALGRWIDAFAALRRRWPDFPDADVEAQAACGMYSALRSARPEDPELPVWERKVLALTQQSADPALRSRAAFALVHFSVWRGDLVRARTLLAAVRGGPHHPDPALRIGWLIHAARTAVTAGEGAEALQLVDEGLAAGAATGHHWWDFGFELVGMWAAALTGDERRGSDHVRRIEASFDVSMEGYFRHARALELVRRGQGPAAREDLRRSLALCDEIGALYPASWNHVGLAAIARQEGDDGTLRHHLAQAESLGSRTGSIIVRYWTCLLRSALLVDGNRPGALRLAAEALRLSREAGPFDEMWIARGDLARVCALALEEGIEPDEARAIVKRRRLDPPDAALAGDRWPWPVSVRTLGGFTIDRAGTAGDRPPARAPRPLAVLQALVALGGREVPEWKVTEALWPDAEADLAQHALESNLHRLRKLLGVEDAIRQVDRKLTVCSSECWVDAIALEAALIQGASRASDPRPIARALLALYRGPFLDGVDEPWARPTRDRLRRRIGAFLERLPIGQDGSAELASALLARDPALRATIAAADRHGAA